MSTTELIMSILAEKPMNLMSWNVIKGKCGSHNGRDVVMFPVCGFKHQGIVAVYPNSLQGYFDIELVNKDKLIVKSVEYISACKLSEIIDQLVEVTEHYFDDIDRWLAQCPSEKYHLQKIGRLAKRFPIFAAIFPLKMGFEHK